MTDLIKMARKIHRNIVLAKDNLKFRSKSRKETFSHIYVKKLWGGGGIKNHFIPEQGHTQKNMLRLIAS